MDVPAIGQTLARNFMPQIRDRYDFLDELELHGISNRLETLDPKDLKSTQLEFDANKVYDIMKNHGENSPIITSKDGYVLDGHHRWLSAHNKGEKIESHVCDASILELLHHAKRYCAIYNSEVSLSEELEAKVESGGIEHKEFGPMLDSFVKFASEKLGITTHPKIRGKDSSDAFNSFAAYHPDSKMTAIETKNRHPMDVFRSVAHELVHHKQDEDGRLYPGAGETGTDIEDEANAMAGRIMRHWATQNPHHFHLTHIKEAVFVVGGPCSGKDRIAREVRDLHEAQEVDILSINKTELEESVIINASASDFGYIRDANNALISRGYNTSMYFVDVTNDISKLRNESRLAKGQRVLAEGVRFEKYEAAKRNMETYKEMFGANFHRFDNSISEEVKKPAAKPEPKQKMVDPHQLKADMEKRGVVAQYHKDRATEYMGRAAAIRGAMVRLQPQGANYKKIHKYLQGQLKGAMLGVRKYQKQAFDAHMKDNINEQFNTFMEHAGFEGTDELRERYRRETPGQWIEEGGKKKVVRKKPKEETGQIDGLGQTVATGIPSWPYSAGIGIGGYSGLGISENIITWAENPKTIERFQRRYGDQAATKILETAQFLSKQDVKSSPRTLRSIQEAIDKGAFDMGTVPNTNNKGEDLNAAVEECGRINKKKKLAPKRKK